MFTNTLRIVLLLIGLVIALFFGYIGYWLQCGLAVMFIILIVAGYFLNGTVFLAIRKLSKNDFEGAERLLKMIRYPKYLAKLQCAYFFMLWGLVEAHKGNYILASTNLESALEKGLRTQHDKVVTLLNLASIYHNLNNKEKAIQRLDAAKAQNINEALQPEIQRLEQALR